MTRLALAIGRAAIAIQAPSFEGRWPSRLPPPWSVEDKAACFT
jgi:hypothetical protein